MTRDDRGMTSLRLALVGLVCLVLLVVYTWLFPHLVASGHQPAQVLGLVLGIAGVGLVVASLVRAVMSSSR
jgi:hypothetical protein